MSNLTPEAVRALLFNRKLKIQAVGDDLIDSWESVDGAQDLVPLKGQLSVLELRGSDTSTARKLATGPDGMDGIQMAAATICKSLVLTETKERVFQDTDFEAVAGFGTSVIQPLEKLIATISGMNPDATAKAKASFLPTPENGSSTSSVVNSVDAPTVSGATV